MQAIYVCMYVWVYAYISWAGWLPTPVPATLHPRGHHIYHRMSRVRLLTDGGREGKWTSEWNVIQYGEITGLYTGNYTHWPFLRYSHE